jgi:hypothetical protein
MITFRVTKQDFKVNTFFTKKSTSIANSQLAFGYLKSIDKKGNCIAIWYSNFIKAELHFKLKELKVNYKSIYPYFNNKVMRGGIWKHSYLTLLNNICPERGFSRIKVDKMTYKIHPLKGNDVIISNARKVLEHNLTVLEGKIIKTNKHVFDVKSKDGTFSLLRCDFEILPQDYFILLAIRCN